jgi:tRNA splicing ligase
MSKVGASIGVATSTVSRALTRLAALGLVSYDTFKGRKGGIRLFTMSGKALKERSQRAWDRIKASKDQAAQRWRNKLEASGYDFASLNVATKRAMDATFSYLHVGEVPWTASDLADAGL